MANDNSFLEFINNETVLNADNLNKLTQIKNAEGTLLHQITMTDNPAEGGNNKIASAEAVKSLAENKLDKNKSAVNSEKLNGKTESELTESILDSVDPRVFGFSIDNEGWLGMYYTGIKAPDFEIDEEGYLILKEI